MEYVEETSEVEDSFLETYDTRKRIFFALLMLVVGILIAGFWNYNLVDGFGHDIVAGKTIGNTETLAGTYSENGSSFGFIFAAIAGLAATFTACNCVAFAMIPGLACATDQQNSKKSAISAIIAFVTPVMLIGATYGVFVGFLGPDGVSAINQRPVRIAQAQTVFSVLGVIMILWGFLELGFFKRITQQFSTVTRDFFSSSTTKAGLMGVLVGLFAVGRPYPVFREFLTYAATAQSPTYGAIVMAIQGLGQVTVMLLLFSALIYFAGNKMMRWSTEKPHQPRLLTALALLGGGSYFVFYWGLAIAFGIGRWGFKLGWY